MMQRLSLPAPAKLNRMLHIVGRRADGYHELQTLFQFLDRSDMLHFSPRDDGAIHLAPAIAGVDHDANLIVRAARLLQHASGTHQGVDIHLDKRLPMGGGLGGGSSDAATTLLALDRLWSLDLGLPRLDGLLLCQRLREAGQGVPVIMLTARDQLEDKLSGFAHGADDYLVKPFALKELEARIGVLARMGKPAPGSILSAAGLELDPQSHVVRREGQAIALTRAQTRILECLIQESPRVVTHERLARVVWGAEGGDQAALHTHIHALRNAMDKPFGHALIHTVHGIGYRLGEAW